MTREADPGSRWPGSRWSEWMRAAQKGDAATYRALLTEILPVLRGMVRRRRGQADDVEDLVQDVLLSLHSVRHTYDPERPFLPWLTTILRYRLADAARRRARRAANEVTVETLPETFSEDQTNIGEDADRLRQAIAALPAGQKQAVELLRLKEMSLKEAAAASGQSVAALKVAMHRALKALKTAFGREGRE